MDFCSVKYTFLTRRNFDTVGKLFIFLGIEEGAVFENKLFIMFFIIFWNKRQQNITFYSKYSCFQVEMSKSFSSCRTKTTNDGNTHKQHSQCTNTVLQNMNGNWKLLFPELYISILTTIIEINTCSFFFNNNIWTQNLIFLPVFSKYVLSRIRNLFSVQKKQTCIRILA